VDKNEFYGNFHPKCFFSFAVTLFARPKKLDAGDHGCFASPSYDEQVIVGRKVVLIGFFGNLRRRFLIKSPCRAPLAHPHAKKLHQLLLHAPGAPTNKISSGDEIATHLLPSSSARSSPVSHADSKGSNILHSIVPQLQTCSPSPPRDLNTPLECCESGAGR